MPGLGRFLGGSARDLETEGELDALLQSSGLLGQRIRSLVGPRQSGVLELKFGSGSYGEVGFASTFQGKFELDLEPGSLVWVQGITSCDLAGDTGVGAGSNLGNGRYSVNKFEVASGSSFADHNATMPDGVTPSTFSAAPKASWSAVDGAGPSAMVQFCPAAPADGSLNGVYGYAATPWVPVLLQPRRDGKPGSVLYVVHQYGGGGASSQHPRGIVNANMKGMQTNPRVSGYVSYRNVGGAPADWGLATDTDSGYHPISIRVMSGEPCANVARAGDSTRIGTSTTGTCTNAVWQAVTYLNASDAESAYGYVCWSCGGTAAPWFHGQALDRLKNAENLPAVLFWQVTSQNISAATTGSPFSAAQVLADWARTLYAIDLCDKLGVAIVLETQQPTQYINNIYSLGGANQATALAMEAQRVLLNGWIRASGRPVLDMDQILTGGVYASGIAYLKGYLDQSGTLDGVHNLDSNEALITPFAVAAIKTALSANMGAVLGSRPPKTVSYSPASDGVKTVFSIPHGLGYVPSDVVPRAGNALAASVPFVATADLNLITYSFATPPAAGTLNIISKVYP